MDHIRRDLDVTDVPVIQLCDFTTSFKEKRCLEFIFSWDPRKGRENFIANFHQIS